MHGTVVKLIQESLFGPNLLQLFNSISYIVSHPFSSKFLTQFSVYLEQKLNEVNS